MLSGMGLAREIQLTDWSTAGNLSNRSSGVQIPRDICTRFGPYLYSTKCSWIIKRDTAGDLKKGNFPNQGSSLLQSQVIKTPGMV